MEREGEFRKSDEGPGAGREFYIEMAKQRNARVVVANTLETYTLSDLIRAADAGIKSARAKFMISIAMEDFAEGMGQYNSAILMLSDAIAGIFKINGSAYREPKGVKHLRKAKNLKPGQLADMCREVADLMERRMEEFAAANGTGQNVDDADEASGAEEPEVRQKVRAA